DLSLDTGTYTFELGFTFFTLGGYQKLIDFANRASDSGFYTRGNSLNFYPVVNTGLVDVRANEAVHVVLTRDGSTGVMAAFVNGQLSFTFTDNGLLGAISGASREIYFFIDDFPTGGEAGPGAVDFIRIYNQSLDAAQVGELFANGPVVVPEPSTAVLLAIGIGAWWLGRVRRCTRE
ncbi:MAG: LamG-like jellyroll fold domain-containing protein, partial [Candidatus Didemnitutus sp.]|nr:LamG-like jellyroll fold domain-containing protein [Candidatus Didemnitutus sp.]